METLEIVLEFARAEATSDPHAFRFAPQSYIVRTPRGAFGSSEFRWDRGFLERLEVIRRPGQDPSVLAEVGETLRRFLAPAGWEALEQRLTAAVRQRQPVQITIRSAAAELFALPWELLSLHATGQSLGGLPGVLVRYEWPGTATIPALADEASGRLVVAWSAAGGEVPAAEHIAAIQASASTSAGAVAFDPDADVIAHASPERLAAALSAAEGAARPIKALHLLCHGGRRGGSFGLVLDGDAADDPPALLDPARLQQLLAPHAGTLRLVVLAACDSGNQGDPGGRLGSAAQRLHRAGFAAVVASRYPLSIAGSTRLFTTFYRQLVADRRPVEVAFVAARTALTSHTQSLDWASVQLYSRAADGTHCHLFASSQPIEAPPEQVALEAGETRDVADATPRRRLAAVAALIGGAAVIVAVAGALLSDGEGEDPATPTTAAASPAGGGPPMVASTGAVETGTSTGARAGAGAEEEEPAENTAEPSTTAEGVAEATPIPTVAKKSTRTKKAATTSPKASVECRSGLKSYVRTLLPPGEGPVVRLVVKANEAGALTATGSAAAEAAKARLRGGSEAKVHKYAGDALPCHFRYEWAQPQ